MLCMKKKMLITKNNKREGKLYILSCIFSVKCGVCLITVRTTMPVINWSSWLA